MVPVPSFLQVWYHVLLYRWYQIKSSLRFSSTCCFPCGTKCINSSGLVPRALSIWYQMHHFLEFSSNPYYPDGTKSSQLSDLVPNALPGSVPRINNDNSIISNGCFHRHFMESFFMQQNLYFLPDPQGHGSFGIIFFDARRTGSFAVLSSLLVPVIFATSSRSTFS